MTIHITPEPDFSYVSFESNVSAANYNDLISRVIKTFQPGKFVVTIFANKVSTAIDQVLTFAFNVIHPLHIIHRHPKPIPLAVNWIMLLHLANGNVATFNIADSRLTI